MAELFEEVVALLESRSSTRAFANQFRIESEQAASNGAVLGVPVFLAALNDWANDSTKSVPLLKTLRSIDTTGLQDPGAAVESRRYEPLGSELTDMLLGSRRAKVASVISGEAGISERSADGLLPPTAWTVMASIADRYGSRIDRQSLIAVLSREQNDLIEGGWGPWLDATGEGSLFAQDELVSDELRYAEGVAESAPAAATASTTQQAGTYPPPVARSARLVGDEPQSLPRPSSRLGNGGRSGTVTGPVSHRRSATTRVNPERVREPQGSNRLLTGLGILLLFLLGAAAIYWLFNGRDADDAASDGVEVVTEDPAEAEAEAGEVVPAELVAIDVIMDDPQGRSPSTGVAELRFNVEAEEICYNVNAEQIGSPFDGHIHVGPAGVKGGIVVDFGPLTNSSIGCTPVDPGLMTAILNDQSGHYVEMHDPSADFTIRAQLSEAMAEDDQGDEEPETEDTDSLFDPDSGGAMTVIESGRMILQGAVADQETFDRLAAEYLDVESDELVLVNELTIVEGSPLPTGQITIDDTALFDVNSDQLIEGRGTALVDLAMVLKARPMWLVTVVGHTDSTGDEVYNLELSFRRAGAVREELMALGVPPENLRATGSGSLEPVADNTTPEGRALNRRIEFKIDRG